MARYTLGLPFTCFMDRGHGEVASAIACQARVWNLLIHTLGKAEVMVSHSIIGLLLSRCRVQIVRKNTKFTFLYHKSDQILIVVILFDSEFCAVKSTNTYLKIDVKNN